MEAFFEHQRYPKVQLIIGGRRKKQLITAILDTGFDGHLCIPISIAVQLGIELRNIEQVQYADGRVSSELVFDVDIVIDNKTQTVPATLTSSSQSLAGTSLFEEKSITLNFRKKYISITSG